MRVAGVILNKVGSDRHEAMLREALEGCGVPVFGALRRTREVRAPSRHLGLVPVAERQAEAVDSAAALAARVREGCDLEGLLALARSAPPLSEAAWDPEEEMRRAVEAVPGAAGRGDRAARPVVAVAGGAAFTFSYAEHTELLTAAGARVVPFDPLRDEHLPEGTGGLVIGGGFPEVYAPSCPRTSRCGQPSPSSPRPARPSPPNVPDCCIWRARWTGSRCAGCWPPRHGCRNV
ncbi:hypothetical protein SSPO_074040 [Streptomyces antimycoticus]|uniref:CobQ/CobB/MinD/ParA nucleotide binding domain-containing protein n=1 Tax=Streptomyces antimycoticus TaxID=68175 RepID=A0A499V8U3_9ACTN|nr:hypothetical protein SSPO_074040 [Streptomyces antimycoticus]